MNAIVNIAKANQAEEVEDDITKEINEAGGALGRVNGGMVAKAEELTIQSVTRRLNRFNAILKSAFGSVTKCHHDNLLFFLLVQRRPWYITQITPFDISGSTQE